MLNDRPGEPIALAVLPDGRVLHTARTGEVRIHNPRTGLNTDRGRRPRKNLSARRGGGAGSRHRLEVREEPLGLPRTTRRRRTRRWTSSVRESTKVTRPNLNTPADPRGRLAQFKGVRPPLALQARGETRSTLTPSSRSSDVPVDRGICCHVGGKIDFDGSGNLFLSTGDDTNPFQSEGYSPIDERSTRNPAFDAQRTAANTNDLRGKILRIRVKENGGYEIPRGNLFRPGTVQDPSGDLRDGLPQPVPLRGRPQVRGRLRRRLLARCERGQSASRPRRPWQVDADSPARQLRLALLRDA